MRDLFNDAPMDPQAKAKASEHRAMQEAARLERRANGIYRRLVCVVDAIGACLARLPDGAEADALANIFHITCGWL